MSNDPDLPLPQHRRSIWPAICATQRQSGTSHLLLRKDLYSFCANSPNANMYP